MRIYKGWKIRSLHEDTKELDGAVIVQSGQLRKTYFYQFRDKFNKKWSIRRNVLLRLVNESQIEFYV